MFLSVRFCHFSSLWRRRKTFPLLRHTSLHYGTKPGHFETSKIHFPTSEGVSEVSERASERVSGASERTSEWPSTYVSILVFFRPQCLLPSILSQVVRSSTVLIVTTRLCCELFCDAIWISTRISENSSATSRAVACHSTPGARCRDTKHACMTSRKRYAF